MHLAQCAVVQNTSVVCQIIPQMERDETSHVGCGCRELFSRRESVHGYALRNNRRRRAYITGSKVIVSSVGCRRHPCHYEPAMCHSQRLQHMFLDIFLVRLTGNTFERVA